MISSNVLWHLPLLSIWLLMVRYPEMLKVFSLSKIYPPAKTYAIENLTFSVNQGEIIGLLGPNGAGKTTTIKCICGLVNPTRGTIEIDGPKIKAPAEKVSVLLEGNRNIYWRLTVFENLSFFSGLQGLSTNKKEIESLISFFRLEEKIRTQARFLSQGMQQKLAVACTLIRNTPILILDEPTLGLDVESSYELRCLLKEITKIYKKTIILSTHDMHVVEDICERIIIINGKLIVDETLLKLRNFFRINAYKVTIKRYLKKNQKELIEHFFPIVDITSLPHQSVIRLEVDDSEDLYKLFDILKTGKNEIESIEKLDPNFEQVYLNLVQKSKI